MNTNINILLALQAAASAELTKLRVRVAVLQKKEVKVRKDEHTLRLANEALQLATKSFADELATNPGTPAFQADLDRAQASQAAAIGAVKEAKEQLELERFGFKLKWTPAIEAELRRGEERIAVLETRLVAHKLELERAKLKADEQQSLETAKQTELRAKRNRALAILQAEIDQAKQLQQLAVDDPLFGKLAKAPVKPKQAVVVKTEPAPTPVVVPESVVIAAPVVVEQPVVEVSVTPPPAPEPANAKVEEPEHPVLKLFKNWQARNPAKPGMPRRQVAHAIDQAYTAK